MRAPFLCIVLCLLLVAAARGERINHEGRILGPLLSVTNSVLFNTPEADAVVSSMQIFPVDNPWNEDISNRPVLTNSDAMISQIISDLATNRRTLRLFMEMNFALVPTNQPTIPITFFNYPTESDPGPYPIPTNMPIETWPAALISNQTLVQWQQDVYTNGGDRHGIIVMPGSNLVWETWLMKLSNVTWRASNGAKFDMNGNGLRKAGDTSGDAAGLPMFPAIVRYDECQRGMVEHAMRIVVKRTRTEYLYPARHIASNPPDSDINVPAMGERIRLKASYMITNSWTTEEKAVLRALKKYGALVADNGNFFSISIAPDARLSSAFPHMSTISITNFEVIQTTLSNTGPRTANAPQAFAGPDFSTPAGIATSLQGYVAVLTNNPPITNVWKLYSGPGSATFGNTNQTNTTVTFSTPGTYTLLLSGNDGLHPIAYDATVVTVTVPGILLSIARTNLNVTINWTGGTPPYVLDRCADTTLTNWVPLLTNSGSSATVPAAGNVNFFRVRGQ